MSLRSHAVSGVRWMSLATTGTVGLGLLQTVVLSRLLQPEDFGLAGMAWVILGLVDAYADMGMSQALVLRQDVTREQLSSVYWAIAGAGLLCAVAMVLLTPVTVWFYRQPAIAGLMPLASLSFLITCLGRPFQMMLQRNLRFDVLAKTDVTGAACASLVSAALAWRGFGAYSLVLGSVAVSLVKFVMLVGSSWRQWHPGWHFRRRDLHGFLRFGAFRMGEATANYLTANLDYLMIGRFLGAETLGLYRLAYELVVRPLSIINPILNTVMLPLFARKQSDDEALRRGFLEVIRLIATLSFPLLIGLAAVSPIMIPVFFGEKWIPAVILIQILAPVGMLKAIGNPVGALLLAKGRITIGFYWNAVLAVVNGIVFWIAAQTGVAAVAWAWVVIASVYQVASWKSYYYDSIRLDYAQYLRAVCYPALYAVLMGFSAALSLNVASAFIPDRRMVLAAVLAEGAVAYGLLHLFFERTYFQTLKSLVFRKPAGANP